uniref:Uncharacterized protein n=1 Tax=Acrobeloides nanus TaxID=290746 RepID=A0A914DSE8_9BILA
MLKLVLTSTVPKHFECYSCMSLSYQDSWEHLQFLYTAPKVFTNRCNEPNLHQKNIPTVICGSVCISLLEPNVEAGFISPTPAETYLVLNSSTLRVV